MRRVVILPEAVEDLNKVFLYTARTWNEQQAIRYIDQLEDGFNDLAALPSPGKSCADLKPHLRKQPVASHVVYFFADGNELTVVRVLHKKMSPAFHVF